MAPISDVLFAELSAHFDTKQMIELCFTVGNSGIVNRFHALFHTELDADTTMGLGASPLPLPGIADDPKRADVAIEGPIHLGAPQRCHDASWRGGRR